MVNANETREDRTGVTDGLVHYSVAKREGLKAGSMFQIEGDSGFFQVRDYVDCVPGTGSRFSGFRFIEL